MPIPDFQSVMLPLLQHTADNKEHSLPETEDYLAQYFKLNETERNEMLSSGKQSRFGNRVGWAKQHLLKAGLLESPRRSVFNISNRGKDVLSKKPERINLAFFRKTRRGAIGQDGLRRFCQRCRPSDEAYKRRRHRWRHQIGVSIVDTYEIKRLDSDYFDPET